MKNLFVVVCVAFVSIGSFALTLHAQEADLAQANASPAKKTFQLVAVPVELPCLQGSTKNPPTATVTVVQGKLNDTLTIHLKHFKPNLAFDLFTVQRSRFISNGTLDPAFPGTFGLAWYQSDLQVNSGGSGNAKIQTILVNQIFGFDGDAGVALAPINTFHVGFWFNDPNAAATCGFDPASPTPFNGEHAAGPLAMESVPDATSGLGPLCFDPSSTPGECNP